LGAGYLGSLVNYELRMKGGTLTVTVNGKAGSETYTTQYYGTTDGYYFKAGNYLQTSSSSTTTSEVHFYSLEIAGAVVPTSVSSASVSRLMQNDFSWKPVLSAGSRPFPAATGLFTVLGQRIGNPAGCRAVPTGLYFVKSSPLTK
jgi:Alginate lyase